MKPDFITEEDLARWDAQLESDPNIPAVYLEEPVIREVCRAGLWLAEELMEAQCPEALILRIQYTAGRLSFGRDPWEVVQELLHDYQHNFLQFEPDPQAN